MFIQACPVFADSVSAGSVIRDSPWPGKKKFEN
jgi:hypothetical protein